MATTTTTKGLIIHYLKEQELKIQESYGVSFTEIYVDLKLDKDVAKVALRELTDNEQIHIKKGAFDYLIFLT